jgi:site-specific recombinase XerC
VELLNESPKALSRFNSGKWLQITAENKGIRTGSEQIELPPWSIHEGKGNLEVRFRFGTRHPSISTGTKDEKIAKARAPGLIFKWLASRTKATSEHPLQAAAREFLASQYADTKPDTAAEVDTILRRLAGAFPGLASVSELSPKAFQDGLSRYRGTASAGYWTNIVVTTRKFCRWCVDRGYLAEDPTIGIKAPGKGRGKRRGVWAEAYFAEVCAVVSGFDRECLMVMRWSGLDSGDLHTFDPGKHLVRDEAGVLTIKKLREKAKTDEETVVQPVNSRILPYLEARLKSGEGYGAGYASVRSFTASLRKRVQSAMERHSLPRTDLKSLRHSFCTYHAERGVPLDVLRRWCGHSPDSRTLDRYYIHRASTARFQD